VTKADPVMHDLLIKTADGNSRRNPLLKVVQDAGNDMLKFAGAGIGPTARARRLEAQRGTHQVRKFAGMTTTDAQLWDRLMPVIGRLRSRAVAHVLQCLGDGGTVDIAALIAELRARFSPS
jgi:hypothetical protein